MTQPTKIRAERDAFRAVSTNFNGADVGGRGVPVAESAVAPPGPIPNPVVTRRSAGEYCRGDPVGGEAAAGTPRPQSSSPLKCLCSNPGAERRPGFSVISPVSIFLGIYLKHGALTARDRGT